MRQTRNDFARVPMGGMKLTDSRLDVSCRGGPTISTFFSNGTRIYLSSGRVVVVVVAGLLFSRPAGYQLFLLPAGRRRRAKE